MRNDLGLSVPTKEGRNVHRSGIEIILAVSLAVVLVLMVFLMSRRHSELSYMTGGLSADRLKALSLRFEDQKLSKAAARSWTEYIAVSRMGNEETARIWFRIGKLYQEANDYENALEAYYRSEALATLKDIEPEIAKRSAECLENLGKFTALDRALSERTAIAGLSKSGEESDQNVLAEIGTWKITRSDIDLIMEAEVDARIARMGGGLTGEEKLAEKKRLLEELRMQSGRDRFLQQFVAEELLYRYAREEKLDEDAEIRAMVRNLERKALAQAVIDREIAKLLSITPDEIRAYYEGHKEEFKKDDKILPYKEAREEAAASLRLHKALEIQQQLLDRLRLKYNAVIHTSRSNEK